MSKVMTVRKISGLENITPAQFGLLTQTSAQTVIREIKKGNIKAFMVGKQYLIPQEEYQRIRNSEVKINGI